MMHDIARPMKDPLHHRRLLPMKNFFGTVGLKCQTFVNGKNLHVNIVTYSDVYNKHLFHMFKHVLTHYLLWYGPPVVVIQRFFLLLQHRCTLPCTFSLLGKTLHKFYNGCKKTRCGSFSYFSDIPKTLPYFLQTQN